jgi:predicted  nucleic acid-binding Zn-ribbon protein
MAEAKQKKISKKTEKKEIKPAITPPVVDANDADLGADKSVENTLIALYKLQSIYSRIDKIRVIRGELPLEVNDLEDACLGLQTRIEKFEEILKGYQNKIFEKQEQIKKSQLQIAKYKEQLDNVRNNREYDALSKEIEYEELDIQLNEKKTWETNAKITDKKEEIDTLTVELHQTKQELKIKKDELDSIIAETEKEETKLLKDIKQQEVKIEPRMHNAFIRIRNNMRNGLATVKVDRNACGGCFSKISPQRQLDIRMHKKIIVCEFCGRILIDNGIVTLAAE